MNKKIKDSKPFKEKRKKELICLYCRKVVKFKDKLKHLHIERM